MIDRRPMLATPSTGAGNRTPIHFADLMRTGDWVADVKLDGIRAFAEWDGSTLVLTNRNGVDITAKFPEIIAQAPNLGRGPVWLDGEIIADDGRFETALTRDKQTPGAAVRRLAEQMPCRFLAFDLPEDFAQPWRARRERLDVLAGEWEPGRFGTSIVSYDETFLAITRDLRLEGAIAKRVDSRYQFGARSRSWVKFKNLSRVTCLVTGYTAGTGSREHFGAMHLALVDPDGQVVPCGRVGTGFTERSITDLKARLDRKEVLVVEIECLNRTSGDQLRFPVFKGIRSDVDVLAASTAQLDTLPTC